MFTLEVKTNVKLHTGAEINLTDEQQTKIKNYVVELVLGRVDDTTKVKRTYSKRGLTLRGTKRRRILNRWNESEIAELSQVLEKYYPFPAGKRTKECTGAIKDFRNKYAPYRTMSSVISKFLELKEIKDKQQLKEASKWNPIFIKPTTSL